MDEPDGVTGAAAIRIEEPLLQEQILQYESKGCTNSYWLIIGHYKLFLTGNVLDAAVCYQKAIEQDPNRLSNRVVCYTIVFSQ